MPNTAPATATGDIAYVVSKATVDIKPLLKTENERLQFFVGGQYLPGWYKCITTSQVSLGGIYPATWEALGYNNVVSYRLIDPNVAGMVQAHRSILRDKKTVLDATVIQYKNGGISLDQLRATATSEWYKSTPDITKHPSSGGAGAGNDMFWVLDSFLHSQDKLMVEITMYNHPDTAPVAERDMHYVGGQLSVLLSQLLPGNHEYIEEVDDDTGQPVGSLYMVGKPTERYTYGIPPYDSGISDIEEILYNLEYCHIEVWQGLIIKNIPRPKQGKTTIKVLKHNDISIGDLHNNKVKTVADKFQPASRRIHGGI